MSRTEFKHSILWMNIGEVSIVSGEIALSVYRSALLRLAAVCSSFTFQRLKPAI
ncbi:hypothetical protein SAMN05192585_10168 [Acetanaerobacterium elongatum]|uniref:Uncharacterized protein n=1 Tax=Acetanaerobacterium elongatum TaxID=258515 RepID=A0A1G9U4W7_9FIRM|nr:hypothetical protein SAMN05192585_10168 [Acetanaerobacterium elongatum]